MLAASHLRGCGVSRIVGRDAWAAPEASYTGLGENAGEINIYSRRCRCNFTKLRFLFRRVARERARGVVPGSGLVPRVCTLEESIYKLVEVRYVGGARSWMGNSRE